MMTCNNPAAANESPRAQLIADSIRNSGARNVILLIGDGMGDSEITVARNYARGAGGAFAALDAFPLTGQYTHYSLTKDGKPSYVTDSAASGSAWATGTKTYNGAISVDIAGHDQKTLLQLAKEARLRAMKERRPYQVAITAQGFTASRYFDPYLNYAELTTFLSTIDAAEQAGVPPELDEEPASSLPDPASAGNVNETAPGSTGQAPPVKPEWTARYTLPTGPSSPRVTSSSSE